MSGHADFEAIKESEFIANAQVDSSNALYSDAYCNSAQGNYLKEDTLNQEFPSLEIEPDNKPTDLLPEESCLKPAPGFEIPESPDEKNIDPGFIIPERLGENDIDPGFVIPEEEGCEELPVELLPNEGLWDESLLLDRRIR